MDKSLCPGQSIGICVVSVSHHTPFCDWRGTILPCLWARCQVAFSTQFLSTSGEVSCSGYFAKELVEELRCAKAIARRNVQKSQAEQKRHYDRKAKDSELQVGDLAMLKIQPRFRLDCSYKGPFKINH